MSIRRRTWKEKIGKRMTKHLADNNITTLAGFKRALQWQHDNNMPCFECQDIARKLGISIRGEA